MSYATRNIQDAISAWQERRIEATYYIELILDSLRKHGWKLHFSVKKFCADYQIPSSTFYRAKKELVEKGKICCDRTHIGLAIWRPKVIKVAHETCQAVGNFFSTTIPTSWKKDTTDENKGVTHENKGITHENKGITHENPVSLNPISSNGSGKPPTLIQLFNNSLSDREGEREFLDFFEDKNLEPGTKTKGSLPSERSQSENIKPIESAKPLKDPTLEVKVPQQKTSVLAVKMAEPGFEHEGSLEGAVVAEMPRVDGDRLAGFVETASKEKLKVPAPKPTKNLDQAIAQLPIAPDKVDEFVRFCERQAKELPTMPTFLDRWILSCLDSLWRKWEEIQTRPERERAETERQIAMAIARANEEIARAKDEEANRIEVLRESGKLEAIKVVQREPVEVPKAGLSNAFLEKVEAYKKQVELEKQEKEQARIRREATLIQC